MAIWQNSSRACELLNQSSLIMASQPVTSLGSCFILRGRLQPSQNVIGHPPNFHAITLMGHSIVTGVHRVHSWVRLLMTLAPSSLHSAPGEPAGKEEASWSAPAWCLHALSSVCMLSSATGLCHQVLMGNQEQQQDSEFFWASLGNN